MQSSILYSFIVLFWIVSIQLNEVISHFEVDTMEMQHDKEGEKESEKENLKFREWNDIVGLNPKDESFDHFTSSLNLEHDVFHQWSPDIIIPPPKS